MAQDASRLTDWSIAGIRNPSNLPEQIIDFIEAGANTDGTIDNSSLMQSIFDNLSDDGAIILFGNGVFRFESPIQVPSNVVLQGLSASESILEFELSSEDDLIKVVGGGVIGDTIFFADLYKDSLFLESTSTISIEQGDYLIIQDNDDEKITSTWARNTTGQIIEVLSQENQIINLASPLRRDYLNVDKPFGHKIELKTNVGIESIGIRNLKQTQGQTSNILFNNVRDSWVKCVKSLNTNYAHVEVVRGMNLEISGSFFKDGFEYTGGGKAYGVMLHFTTSEVLVINNQFEHLRHSMILQAGANGNVMAYNYSFDAFWEEPGLPSNAAGDLVLHGNYVYANLLEGNIVQNIVLDASHGINGKHNTFFRNRAELFGIVMDPSVMSDGQNFIANEITSEASTTAFYAISGDDHFELANNQKGVYRPALAGNEDIASSLFIAEVPEYYQGRDWPVMGLGASFNVNDIQAKERNLNNQETDCEEVSQTTSVELFENVEFIIYPNPAESFIKIEGISPGLENYQVVIFDTSGRTLRAQRNNNVIDVSEIESGIYIVGIYVNQQLLSSKKMSVMKK